MQQPAAKQSSAVCASSLGSIGKRAWSALFFRAPFGATAIIKGVCINIF